MKDQKNILIVDDDTETSLGLCKYLRGKDDVEWVDCTESAQEACHYVQVRSVDAVVLDLVMPVNDGFFFLAKMQRLNMSPKSRVIVTSLISNEQAIKRAFQMGAAYYMVKPYDHEIVYQRILDVLDIYGNEEENRKKSVDQQIMEIFWALGMPPHLKGYQYLRTAIRMAVDQPSIIYNITKGLYPAIAKKFDVTPTKVELAIRHLLDVVWQRNELANLDQVFGCNMYLKNKKPTNGEFIALVADKILLDQNHE